VLQLVRRSVEVALFSLVVAALGLAAAAQAGPLGGYGLYAIRSASMAPALRVGDLVVAERIDAREVRAGDVVTVAVGSDRTVTHRVVDVGSGPGGAVLRTKGDANARPDPVPVTGDQLRGRVEWRVPLLGFLLAMITMPTGVAALFSIGATLLVAVWLLEDLEAEDEADARKRIRRRQRAPGAAAP